MKETTSRGQIYPRDLTGQKFGFLVVRNLDDSTPPGTRKKWVCECTAPGCRTLKSVLRTNLVSGNSQSCGCRLEAAVVRRTRHGYARRNRTDGTYATWKAMLRRVDGGYSKPSGDLVSVDPRWRDIATFVADVGERPGRHFSLERLDLNGDYRKENCRWETAEVQTRNRRTNRLHTVFRTTLCERDWTKILRCSYRQLREILVHPHGLERACRLFAPEVFGVEIDEQIGVVMDTGINALSNFDSAPGEPI